MTCQNCAMAAVRMHWPVYSARCIDCCAREIAQGPAFWRTRLLREITPEYRAQLAVNWPQDTRAGHRAVQDAWRALRQPRLIA